MTDQTPSTSFCVNSFLLLILNCVYCFLLNVFYSHLFLSVVVNVVVLTDAFRRLNKKRDIFCYSYVLFIYFVVMGTHNCGVHTGQVGRTGWFPLGPTAWTVCMSLTALRACSLCSNQTLLSHATRSVLFLSASGPRCTGFHLGSITVPPEHKILQQAPQQIRAQVQEEVCCLSGVFYEWIRI